MVAEIFLFCTFRNVNFMLIVFQSIMSAVSKLIFVNKSVHGRSVCKFELIISFNRRLF